MCVFTRHGPVQTASSRTVELTTIASNYHIEINPGDVGIYDRLVVQEMVKEMAQSKPLDGQSGVKTFKGERTARAPRPDSRRGPEQSFCSPRWTRCRETHSMRCAAPWRSARHRRAPARVPATHPLTTPRHRHMGSCRVILCCQNVCRVIDPVRSRCLCVRVPAPTEREVRAALARRCGSRRLVGELTFPATQLVGVLQQVGAKEGVPVPVELAARISKASERNTRRALLMLEACRVQQCVQAMPRAGGGLMSCRWTHARPARRSKPPRSCTARTGSGSFRTWPSW